MLKSYSLTTAFLGCFLISSMLTGCSGGSSSDAAIAKANENNIQRLANLYFTYQMKNNWQGPPNEGAFKTFIRGYNPKKLTRIGIDPNAIDELFVNERDGEIFKIRYSVTGSAMGCTEPVIFESAGVGGKFMVGFLNMKQREVEETEYQELFAKKAPSSKNTSNRGN